MEEIKVRLKNGIYNVVDTKSNLELFNNKEYDSFFIECSPEESKCGFDVALVNKRDVIEVLDNDK